jgi:hypothetical protein
LLAEGEHKIARKKDNGEDLKIFAKNAGSNYFLKNRRLEFSFSNPYKALAAPASAASADEENLLCARFWKNSNLFQRKLLIC